MLFYLCDLLDTYEDEGGYDRQQKTVIIQKDNKKVDIIRTPEEGIVLKETAMKPPQS